jgi:hypothetical protein
MASGHPDRRRKGRAVATPRTCSSPERRPRRALPTDRFEARPTVAKPALHCGTHGVQSAAPAQHMGHRERHDRGRKRTRAAIDAENDVGIPGFVPIRPSFPAKRFLAPTGSTPPSRDSGTSYRVMVCKRCLSCAQSSLISSQPSVVAAGQARARSASSRTSHLLWGLGNGADPILTSVTNAAPSTFM